MTRVSLQETHVRLQQAAPASAASTSPLAAHAHTKLRTMRVLWRPLLSERSQGARLSAITLANSPD